MAPRRGARVIKVDQVLDYNNLTAKEVLCPICRSILIEPVTLPCHHVFCSSCFQGTMENANLVCPLCRIRIGSWLRSSKKENKLINMDYWNAIKKLFPLQIKNKLEGIDDNLDFEAPIIRLAEPGELKKEYEIEIQKETEVIRKEQEAEAKASEELIRKIREEEEYQKVVAEEKLRLDEEIAKKLAEELNSAKNNEKSKQVECLQSTSKMKNHFAKVGPLDRFLKYKYLKEIPNSSAKDAQSKKIDFAKKEYTCRILCQDIGDDWNLVGQKSTIDFNSSNLNILNKKISAELDRVMEVEGNSDSSDSIDSEYRYFKPVDYRRNPPCQKTIPIKVPSVRAKVIHIEISAPQGQNMLHGKPGISAFARFITPILQIKEAETSKILKPPRQSLTRRKSISPEKKLASPKVRNYSSEKKPTESRPKSASPSKKTNNSSNNAEKSNIPSSAIKKEYQMRITKPEKMYSPSKRKISDTGSEVELSRKKSKSELNGSFSRHLTTPSSPFRGFCTTNVLNEEPVLKTSPRNSRSKTQQLKLPLKNNQGVEKEKIDLQVKADYELARKLQDQYNSITYSTRSSAPRKSIKVTRQTTLDNIVSKKSYKV